MLKHYICIFLIIVELKMVYILYDLTTETDGIYLLVNYNLKNPH